MKRTFLTVVAFMLTVAVAQAQDFKIGYTNIDAIVFSMPEIEGIRSELDTYQQQLTSQINEKRGEINTKMQALQTMAQDPNAVQLVLQEKQNEIIKLQEDLQAFSVQAEQAYGNKENTLVNPVYTKVQAAIEEVRKEKGYAMILNAQTGNGGGIVLAASEDDNITEAVFAKLGVPMPTPPAEGNGN